MPNAFYEAGYAVLLSTGTMLTASRYWVLQRGLPRFGPKYGPVENVLEMQFWRGLEGISDVTELMCSYTRDPHLGPKGRPLPPFDVAMRKGKYTRSLDVKRGVLQLQAGSRSYTRCPSGP
jgi:hypothetical protein